MAKKKVAVQQDFSLPSTVETHGLQIGDLLRRLVGQAELLEQFGLRIRALEDTVAQLRDVANGHLPAEVGDVF